ncbi:MAG: CDP-diacylglycerol--glycerol-3-phosphate 3-phosphatidyltransferase [Victivallales bacterium]|nr:CDP-diacylglycerol--glycerol-3-phosphate 3-phosphatidyltransferase [Victivallales bacterium]
MNLANKITIARIVMVFIFLIVCNVDEYIADDGLRYAWRVMGLCFIIFAGLTDIADGYIARKYDMVTDFGRLMDPLADKIFMATAFVMLAAKQFLPGWVAVVILCREFLVTGLRLLAAGKGEVISADTTGKIKTLSQMIFLAVGGSMWVGWIDPASAKKSLLWTFYYSAVAALTVYSGIVYFVRHRSLYQEDV